MEKQLCKLNCYYGKVSRTLKVVKQISRYLKRFQSGWYIDRPPRPPVDGGRCTYFVNGSNAFKEVPRLFKLIQVIKEKSEKLMSSSDYLIFRKSTFLWANNWTPSAYINQKSLECSAEVMWDSEKFHKHPLS